MSFLIPVFNLAEKVRVGPGPVRVRSRHSTRVRGLVLALAVTLALFLVAAAGHKHESRAESHLCAICTVLMDELPSAHGLPPVVATVAALCYVMLPIAAYVCWYRRPPPKPPSCGPPLCTSAT